MDKKLENIRHSCSHLMASAVKELFPKVLPTIGPVIENGFYYDFDFGKEKISDTDLVKIEKKMRELLPKWNSFEKIEMSLEEAKKIYKDNPYKLELIKELSDKKEKITFYESGKFLDLCRGGHSENPSKELKNFKLLSIAGAYWKGDEKNKMLTRIYGTCFSSKEELDKYLNQIEEGKKRDHRILGPKLNLFVIHDDIGKGLPLLTPKGTVIRNEIIKYERELERENGFEEVWTPHIAKNDLYKRTGHWQHYQDVMYAPFGIDNETYVLKPMNCPHHYMIYSSVQRSYRDLPIRLSEPGTCYRYEKSGELGGLTRVRALTVDDSHILMREDQIDQEFDTCIEMVIKMFKAFGLTDYYVRLSLNDPDDNAKYIADPKIWKQAGEKLEKIVKRNNLKYVTIKGEASFYGPKIDFMVKDAIGREWQMSTLQLDLFMAKKLDLTYISEDGSKAYPVILHRGLTGSLERTIGILIEHYEANFPTWLSPMQVSILPISEKINDYAKKVYEKLFKEGIRVNLNLDGEPLGSKIRKAQMEKVPYMIIIGEKEEKDNKITVRTRSGKDLGQIDLDKFIQNLSQEINEKKIN
ncbi:MAG: threonine--tRNA ligase [Patescibacteria group bacterium]